MRVKHFVQSFNFNYFYRKNSIKLGMSGLFMSFLYFAYRNNNSSLYCKDKDSLGKSVGKYYNYKLNNDELEKKYPNLYVIRSQAFNNLLDEIRNKHVQTSEFRKKSKRLIRILLEEALALEYTTDCTKETPCGSYDCKVNPHSEKDYIAVSILRSGDAIMDELLNIMPDVKIGKILVQRNENSEEKEALYFFDKLPSDIVHTKALVLDPMIATGGSASSSIKILLNKGVKEENIVFINIVGCEVGIKNILTKFPKIKVIVGVCDPELLPNKYIAPGLGDFGDRYYGTD